MLDLQPLRDLIEDGGDPDLYWGVRRLDKRFPVRPEVSDTFMQIAHVILRLYPHRTETMLENPYDARIICMDFNNNPCTSRDDLIRVLDAVNKL